MMSAARFRELVSGRRSGPLAAAQRAALGLASIPYSLVVGSRNRRFDQARTTIHRVGAPVVSVGNITLGGTGKTPMVEWIARWLRQHDLRVALVSRGYKAEAGSVNDEALVLEEMLPDVPHVQNADRVEAARMAIEEFESQVILLDDAFQHRRIHRDLDIVLIDATEPFGFDHVFPRGTLREPLSGLARADLIAITRVDCVAEDELASIRKRLSELAPDAPIIEITHAPRSLRQSNGDEHPIATLANKKVAALCGIGNPRGFAETIRACDFELVKLREFPDHHAFTRDDIESLQSWATNLDVDAVLCTHKDLVKLKVDQIADKPLFGLTISVGFLNGEADLTTRLSDLLPV